MDFYVNVLKSFYFLERYKSLFIYLFLFYLFLFEFICLKRQSKRQDNNKK